VHLRRGPEPEPVLDPSRSGTVGHQGRDGPGDPARARERRDSADRVAERLGVAVDRGEGQRAPHQRRVGQLPERDDGESRIGHRRGVAADERQGVSAAEGQRQGQRGHRERGQITGADAAPLPDRRELVARDQLQYGVEQLRGGSATARGEGVRPDREHRPDPTRAAQRAGRHRVTVQQVRGTGLGIEQRGRAVRADAGGPAVDGPPGGHLGGAVARPDHDLDHSGRDRQCRRPVRDPGDVGARQRAAVEDNGVRGGAAVDRSGRICRVRPCRERVVSVLNESDRLPPPHRSS
jgi:hypothetical protein